MKRILGQQQQIQCELCTVSQVLLQQSLPHIDLLKVDVERAELEVLEGIVVEDWPKIKQVRKLLRVFHLQRSLSWMIRLCSESSLDCTRVGIGSTGYEHILIHAVGVCSPCFDLYKVLPLPLFPRFAHFPLLCISQITLACISRTSAQRGG